MKKIFLPIVVLLIFALTACGGNVDTGALVESAQNVAEDVVDSVNDELNQTDEEMTEEPTLEPTEEPTSEPTLEPTEEPTSEPTAEPTAKPTEVPTEVPTEAPTEVPEGVSPDWVELQADTLQDPVFLTGMLLDDRTVTESQGQATLATSQIFAYRNFPYYVDHPLLGITSGMNGWALVVSDASQDFIFAPTAKESQTAAGSAALQNLITLTANNTLVLKDIGGTNNPVKEGDIVEISYGSAGNMSLPYILTIYRPETGEILVEFEINNQ